MSVTYEACIFCEQRFLSRLQLIDHLICAHKTALAIAVGESSFVWSVRRARNRGVVRIDCICGGSFHESMPLQDRLFNDLPRASMQFSAHLAQVSGLAKHLDDLRQQAILDKIAGSLGDSDVNMLKGMQQVQAAPAWGGVTFHLDRLDGKR